MPYQGLVAGTRPATTLLPRLHTSTDFIRCAEICGICVNKNSTDICEIRGICVNKNSADIFEVRGICVKQ